MPHCVYLLSCSDRYESLYVGYTSDLTARLADHNAGEGAKFTRGRTPVSVRYVEYWPDKSTAMSREWALKQYTRAEKEELVPDADDRVRVAVEPLETGEAPAGDENRF